MTNWRPDFNPDHLYFVTTGTVKHALVFRRDVIKRLVVDTLDCFRSRGRFLLYIFVVMPNHIHLIIQCYAGDPLCDVMRDLKKTISDRIVRHYRATGNQAAFDFLTAQAANIPRQSRKVWEDGYNAKDVFSSAFLRQKMDYSHGNPCQPHWQLSETPAEYPWSSARFYELDEPAIIPVDDVRLLLV